MKKSISFLLVGIPVLLISLSSCRKQVETTFQPQEVAGTPNPISPTYCRIESLWENPGMPGQRYILIMYNQFENPIFISAPSPSTGHPFRTFKYDNLHRMREYRGEYANGNYEFWHFYGFDLNGRIGRDTMYTIGAMGPTGPATYFERAISQITYDAQGRIIKVVTDTQISPSHTETNYTYNASGNLVKPGVVYDNKMNMNRTNDIWQFLNRDYSANNPFAASAYNGTNYPTVINSPSNILWLEEYQLKNSQIGYGCRQSFW
jgi:YD repeat-containing protein